MLWLLVLMLVQPRGIPGLPFPGSDTIDTSKNEDRPLTGGGTPEKADVSKQIADLEVERSNLLKQISSAVMDLTTDGAVLEGEEGDILAKFMADDYERLPGDTRRAAMKKLDKDAHLFDIENLYSKKDRLSKKWKNRMANKAKIQEKLDKWLHDRMVEKEKIKAYKDKERKKNMNKEKCPNFGWKKGKKFRRTNYDGRAKGAKYPCCRKCCKSSYIHCL